MNYLCRHALYVTASQSLMLFMIVMVSNMKLREAKKFLIRYLKDVRTTQLALGRREVRVQGAGS